MRRKVKPLSPEEASLLSDPAVAVMEGAQIQTAWRLTDRLAGQAERLLKKVQEAWVKPGCPNVPGRMMWSYLSGAGPICPLVLFLFKRPEAVGSPFVQSPVAFTHDIFVLWKVTPEKLFHIAQQMEKPGRPGDCPVKAGTDPEEINIRDIFEKLNQYPPDFRPNPAYIIESLEKVFKKIKALPTKSGVITQAEKI